METRGKNTALYKALNIPVNSTPSQIRKGFYKVAKKASPDKHVGHPEWQAINDKFAYYVFAYEILKDPETKSVYDNKGFTGLKSRGVSIPAGFEDYKDPVIEAGTPDSKKLDQFKAKLASEMKTLEEYWARRIEERMRLQEEAKQKFHFATYKQIIQIAWKKEILNEKRRIFTKYYRYV